MKGAGSVAWSEWAVSEAPLEGDLQTPKGVE
jgi:hypothetical protein